MRLYVIRHGESEANREGSYAGQTHSALTEKGFEDAKGIRPYLEKIRFDKVYTSDLKRAVQTAMAALPGCEYEKTPLIREYDVGNLVGRKFTECNETLGEEFCKNRREGNYVPYGGENVNMVMNRARQFLDTVAKTDYECVAAFSHAGMMRALLGCVLHAKILPRVIQCTNCSVGIFEYKNDRWQFCDWINPEAMNLN